MEIATQRSAIGQLLGKVRDLENDLPEDGVQRVVTENTTLKQQVRQLTQDKNRLEKRLKGARDNNRFLDKRIADLETQLISGLSFGDGDGDVAHNRGDGTVGPAG